MNSEERLERAQRVANALGALFVHTGVPVIALTLDGRFVSANAATVKQYGYSLEELLQQRIHDFIADGRSIEEDLLRAGHEHQPSLARRPHKRKDGSVVWVIPRAGPMDIEGERLIVSVLTEVTAIVEAEQKERAATESALRDRHVILGAIQDMLRQTEVAAGLEVLARGFTQAVWPRATVWLQAEGGGNELRLVASHGLSEEYAAQLADARLDWGREGFAQAARAAREARAFEVGELQQAGFAHAICERLGRRCIVAPLVGREGAHGLLLAHGDDGDIERALALATTLAGFGGLILDAAKAERRAEAVWQAASERLTDGIALLDQDLRILRLNSAADTLLGVGADAVGRKCNEVFPICQGQDPCPHRVAATERLHLSRELQGMVRPIRVDIIPATANAAGIAVIHVVHDLSEERAMRTRLLTADRLATIGRLSAGVAHEINNPAAFVSVNLGVLRDRVLAGTAQASDALAMLEESMNGMERIREIVRDLKGFARERSRDVVDLSQIALSATRIAAHETRGRARVERFLAEGILARARGARIAQCVLNLIVNAAQAIPPGNPQDNRIEVRTYRAGERVRLEVTDTGPGVPNALKQRIFEPFFTTREASGGTGLGLWLARGIVEEEDGQLTVEDAPGRGARFIIDLPAFRAEAQAEAGASR